ncbi:hypothetical protein AB0D47_39510 [Streptomyces sp. NPDC048376]|jgi:hypothetical protein|uniref:hypothetical protein n=1 Tax=unclassified Streptomyces TaxID=2593676 RepID=UPI000B30FB13
MNMAAMSAGWCGSRLTPCRLCCAACLPQPRETPADRHRRTAHAKKNRDGTTRPGLYQHLGEEFERRLKAQRDAGKAPDPRTSQIERLKAQVAELKERVAKRDEALAELTAFKTLAVSRLTAQHEELQRLRQQASQDDNVRRLPAACGGTAPYESCN